MCIFELAPTQNATPFKSASSVCCAVRSSSAPRCAGDGQLLLGGLPRPYVPLVPDPRPVAPYAAVPLPRPGYQPADHPQLPPPVQPPPRWPAQQPRQQPAAPTQQAHCPQHHQPQQPYPAPGSGGASLPCPSVVAPAPPQLLPLPLPPPPPAPRAPAVARSTSTALTAAEAAASAGEGIDLSELEVLGNIGGGSFGQVFKGKWRGTLVAVKILHTLSAGPGGSGLDPGVDLADGGGGIDNGAASVDDAALAEFSREIAMLSRLRHPNVCLFMGCCLSPPTLAIVSELVSRGSLWDVLREPGLDPHNPYFEGAAPGARGGACAAWRPAAPACGPVCGACGQRLGTGCSAWSWERLHSVANGVACGMAYLHGIRPNAVRVAFLR